MTERVVVIGAGIVGVATGLWLRRLGAEVTIVDRKPPGQATSFGNAGLLAVSAVVPVTTPGLAAKGPKLLLDPDYPLFLRWPYLPRLLPWLVRYLGHANDADARRTARDLTTLIGDAVEQHQALAKGGEAEAFVRTSDYVFAYADRAAFEADAYVWALRRENGFAPEIVDGEAVREYDPAYGPAIGRLAIMPNHGFVTNPGGYVAALAEDFVAAGGTIRQAAVKDLALDGGRIARVLTDAGPIDCDRAVLATGAWSGPLLAKLGVKLPLETERGYHIVFKSPEGGPKAPTMIASGKFVATPMAMGLRCAGIVEFGGLEAGPSNAPLALLRRQAKAAFPDLTWSAEEPWLGHRPTLADSLPAIGEIGETGVFAAFGHHHVGLTGGAKTGRLTADLIAGRTPNMDLAPYSPLRFRR